jgi:hypothetical protein
MQTNFGFIVCYDNDNVHIEVNIRGGSMISSYGGVHKKIAQSGGRRENIWGISCEKSRFYAKKILFFPILGGRGAPSAPPGSVPRTTIQKHWSSKTGRNFGINLRKVIDIFIWTIELCHIWIFFKHFFNRTLLLATTNAMIYSSTFLRTTITNL